jgi:hypothetical protein
MDDKAKESALGVPDAMAESKSMENILLETSPLDDSFDIGTRTQSNATLSSLAADEEALSGEEQSPSQVKFDMEVQDPAKEAEREALEYFKSGEGEEGGKEENSGLGEDLDLREGNDEDDGQDADEQPPTVKPHLHFSISREEEVSFEEEKGEGLKPTMSTRSLSKFFANEAGGTDSEGKSFFDAFTASEGDDPLCLPSSPSVERERALSGSSETPSSPTKSLPPESVILSELGSSRMHTTSLSDDSSLFPQSSPIPSDADAFTSSMKTSEKDRRKDAWLPSEPTRLALVNLLTSPRGTFHVPSEQLTLPGLINDSPQVRAFSFLIYKLNSFWHSL